MARCGCNNTCSCVVQGGDRSTVTGTGSASDPYIVNGEPTVVTAGDGIMVTGTGSAADPYVVSTDEADDCCPRVISSDGSATVTSAPGGDGQTVYDVTIPPGADCCPTVVAGPSGNTTVTPTTDPVTGQTTYTVDSTGGGGTPICGTPFTAAEVGACGAPGQARDEVFCAEDGRLYSVGDPEPVGAATQTMAVNVPSLSQIGTFSSAVESGSITNNSCEPMLLQVFIITGNTDLNAQGPNTTTSAQMKFSDAVNAAPPPLVFQGGRSYQVSNQIPRADGSPEFAAINVAFGLEVNSMTQFVLAPGATYNWSAQNEIQIAGGVGAAGSGTMQGSTVRATLTAI